MLTHAMAGLAEHWDDVLPRLSAADQQRLVRDVREFLRGEDEESRTRAATRLMEYVAPALPASHPVRRALAREENKSGTGVLELDWDVALRDLLERIGPEDWILAAPAVSESEVRRAGADPRDPGLIRLSPPGGAIRLPAFQFDPDGRPHRVVTEVNRMLDAEDDPWGVADWWLGVNAWIGDIPAESIGQVADEVLISAARALFEEG